MSRTPASIKSAHPARGDAQSDFATNDLDARAREIAARLNPAQRRKLRETFQGSVAGTGRLISSFRVLGILGGSEYGGKIGRQVGYLNDTGRAVARVLAGEAVDRG